MLGTLLVLGVVFAQAQPDATISVASPNGGWGVAWSPKGDWLAFLSSAGGLPAEAWICDREGKTFRQLTHGGADNLSWSHDGRKVRFVTTRRGQLERWQVDLRTGQESPETVPAGVPAGAVWEMSPTGKAVAFVPVEGNSRDLYVYRPGKTKPAPVTADFIINSFAWSPTSDILAFDGTNPLTRGLPQVWSYNVATNKLGHLGSAGSYGPVWSPAGDHLAYRVLYSREGNRIATTTPDGKLGKLIKTALSPGDGLDWKPRANLLAVAARGTQPHEVWLITPEGVVKTKLSRPDLEMHSPSWSPDGRWLAIEGLQQRVSSASEVWVTDAAGKTWRNLTPSRPSFWGLTLARDGGIFFLSNTGGRPHVAAAGTQEMPAVVGSELVRQVAADPVHDRLAVLLANSVALYETDGTALGMQTILKATEVTWSSQGDRLAVTVRARSGETVKLFAVSDEGKLTEVAFITGSSPTWRPDGTLAFVRGAEIWQVDGEGRQEARVTSLPAAEGESIVSNRVHFDAMGNALVAAALRKQSNGCKQELWVVRDGQTSKVYEEPVKTQFGLAPERYGALPAWSADGRVLFLSDREGSPQVWSVRADGSELHALTPAESVEVVVTPDGTAMYFVRLDQDSPIWKAATDGSALAPVAGK